MTDYSELKRSGNQNRVALNSLRIALKSYFSTYKSVATRFNEFDEGIDNNVCSICRRISIER